MMVAMLEDEEGGGWWKRERERRVLSSVSRSAVPLLFFVNTLAGSGYHFLAKSASVSGQIQLRFLVPTLSPSPYAPTLSPTHMTQITSRGLLPSSNLANHPFGLVAEVAQASTIHQPLSGHHVTPPFYIRTRAYLWKKNDALVVHAT